MLIKNGAVFDSFNGMNGAQVDLLMEGDTISACAPDIDVRLDSEVFDASGLLVCPGLIDMHVHAYQYATPLGVDVDRCCLHRGTTTAVDAGSAGASTFMGLQKYVMERVETRVLSFLHIANHGLASAGCLGRVPGGESDSLDHLNVESCAECIGTHPENIKGVKVRVATAACNRGLNEAAALERALAVSTKTNIPLMVHHGVMSSISTSNQDGSISCPGSLRPGDLLTHCFHGMHKQTSIVNTQAKCVIPEAWNARNRGVLFDIGHGFGSFNWKAAEIAVNAGFWPDTISTDLHVESWDGPAYDLPAVMSKLLHVGMSLDAVIKAVTLTPATVLKQAKNLGSLSPGTVADVTILKVCKGALELEDCCGDIRRLNEWLEPFAVFKDGKQFPIKHLVTVPNREKWPALAINADELYRLSAEAASQTF